MFFSTPFPAAELEEEYADVVTSLAYAEMRLVLARFALDFDFELQQDSENWGLQKLFTFWEKPPLMVKILPAE